MNYKELVMPKIKTPSAKFWIEVFLENGFKLIPNSTSTYKNYENDCIVFINSYSNIIQFRYNENSFFNLPNCSFKEYKKINGYYKVIQYMIYLEKNYSVYAGYEPPPKKNIR